MTDQNQAVAALAVAGFPHSQAEQWVQIVAKHLDPAPRQSEGFVQKQALVAVVAGWQLLLHFDPPEGAPMNDTSAAEPLSEGCRTTSVDGKCPLRSNRCERYSQAYCR